MVFHPDDSYTPIPLYGYSAGLRDDVYRSTGRNARAPVGWRLRGNDGAGGDFRAVMRCVDLYFMLHDNVAGLILCEGGLNHLYGGLRSG